MALENEEGSAKDTPYSTFGWDPENIVASGTRFRHAPRVSASMPRDEMLATIAEHEKSGVPLVIEGWHQHPDWPGELFTLDWLEQHAPQQSQYQLWDASTRYRI
jgi:hypothetical protein